MSQNSNTTNGSRSKSLAMTRRITASAILAAMAVVLMYLEVSLPFMPPFLKFDFSEIPVLVGAFALGPIEGMIIELLKNLIHLPATGTQGIGELSNFITGSIFVMTAGFCYKRNTTRKGAVISMLLATAVLTLFAIPFNYFFTLPIYGSVLGVPTEAIIGMTNAVNPLVKSKMSLIMWGFVPFNLFKGLVVCFITFWIYKPISKLIRWTSSKTKAQATAPATDKNETK